MPSGFMLSVNVNLVQLWNFDDQQDKNRMSCKLESQVKLPAKDAITNCAFNDKRNLLVLLHSNWSVSAIQLGKLH